MLGSQGQRGFLAHRNGSLLRCLSIDLNKGCSRFLLRVAVTAGLQPRVYLQDDCALGLWASPFKKAGVAVEPNPAISAS